MAWRGTRYMPDQYWDFDWDPDWCEYAEVMEGEQVWRGLQAIPSYCERYQHELNGMMEGLRCHLDAGGFGDVNEGDLQAWARSLMAEGG